MSRLKIEKEVRDSEGVYGVGWEAVYCVLSEQLLTRICVDGGCWWGIKCSYTVDDRLIG